MALLYTCKLVTWLKAQIRLRLLTSAGCDELPAVCFVNRVTVDAVSEPSNLCDIAHHTSPVYIDLSLLLQIIECSFDPDRRVWTYMRDRPDKLTANHRSVFDKVMASIEDNITVRVACHGQC